MRLSAALQLKATPDQAGVFEGLASTFGGPPDPYGDIIAPGAYTKTLETHKSRQTMPALLWAHDQATPIGAWLAMEESSAGLWVTGKLTLGTAKGAEAYELMKDGALGLSIGFLPKQWAKGDDGARVLQEIELLEVSAVAIPACAGARIHSVKTALKADARSFEQVIRHELGLSAREAKRICAQGWRGFANDTDPEAAGSEKHLPRCKSLLQDIHHINRALRETK